MAYSYFRRNAGESAKTGGTTARTTTKNISVEQGRRLNQQRDCRKTQPLETHRGKPFVPRSIVFKGEFQKRIAVFRAILLPGLRVVN